MNSNVLPVVALCSLVPATASQTAIYGLDGKVQGELYGRAVAILGDLDADGRDEFLVSAAQDSTVATRAGAVHVQSGATGMNLATVYGSAADDYLGWSVASAGDVDADGSVDFIAGAPSACGTGKIGYARVFSGATFAPLATVQGDGFLDWFGCSVTAAGDQDFDGHADFAVGAHQFCGGFRLKGYVRSYSGLDASPRWTAFGASDWDTYGWKLALLGDYDVDGVADLIVGSPGNDTSGYDAGRFYLLSGTDGSTLYYENGEAGLHYSGWSVAGIGDADQDGTLDYAIGVPGEQDAFGDGSHPAEFGKLQIHNGATHTVTYEVVGAKPLDYLGWSVAALGDVDQDGHPEVAAAATRYDIQSTLLSLGPAYIEVVSSATGAVLQHIEGPKNEENFQVDLGAGGDVNGDGTPDFVFGSEGAARTPGLARVFSGRKLELSSPQHVLSVGVPIKQALNIESAEHQGKPYRVLGTASGTDPGFLIGSMHAALNPDPYTMYTYNPPSGAILKHPTGYVGVGKSQALFQPAQSQVAGMVGTTIHHLLLVLDPITSAVVFVSAPVPGTFVP